MSDIRMGIYRHYKGPLYLVQGLAHDANAEEFRDPEYLGDNVPLFPDGREVVVYVPLQLDGAHLGARMAVRTLSDWNAYIHANHKYHDYGTECKHFAITQDGMWCHCEPDIPRENLVRRFTYLGDRLEDWMLSGNQVPAAGQ